LRSDKPWSGRLVFDKPRHRLEMGFSRDWPRMNTMPEWFTVEPDAAYLIENPATGKTTHHRGGELIAGLKLELKPGVELRLVVRRDRG
jgi:hypothetical protein